MGGAIINGRDLMAQVGGAICISESNFSLSLSFHFSLSLARHV